MKITIIRHGKVNMVWRKWSTSIQFDRDCMEYDQAPLQRMKNMLKVDLKNPIYISTLGRSRETAEQLFTDKELIETQLLDEVPLRSGFDCKIPLPVWLWNITGRLQWLLSSRRQLEGIRDTRRRADQLIEQIIKMGCDCTWITHGFYMQTLKEELKKYGFVIDKNKISFSNLEKIVAINSTTQHM